MDILFSRMHIQFEMIFKRYADQHIKNDKCEKLVNFLKDKNYGHMIVVEAVLREIFLDCEILPSGEVFKE